MEGLGSASLSRVGWQGGPCPPAVPPPQGQEGPGLQPSSRSNGLIEVRPGEVSGTRATSELLHAPLSLGPWLPDTSTSPAPPVPLSQPGAKGTWGAWWAHGASAPALLFSHSQASATHTQAAAPSRDDSTSGRHPSTPCPSPASTTKPRRQTMGQDCKCVQHQSWPSEELSLGGRALR